MQMMYNECSVNFKQKMEVCMIKCRFTILELLVVIAVISILAALLLPALNSARETARGARCLSNIKQVNTALTAYTVDFTFYPWPFRTAENIVMEQRIIEAGYMKPLRRGAQTYKDRFEVQCDSLRDLVCAEGSTYPVSSYIPNYSNTYGGVLTAGSHGITGDEEYPELTLARPEKVKAPSRKVVFAERKNSGGHLHYIMDCRNLYDPSHTGSEARLGPVHRQNASFAFADGHAASWNVVTQLSHGGDVYGYGLRLWKKYFNISEP